MVDFKNQYFPTSFLHPEAFDPNELRNAYRELQPDLLDWADWNGVSAAFADVVDPTELTYDEFVGRLGEVATYAAESKPAVGASNVLVQSPKILASDWVELDSADFPQIHLSVFYRLNGTNTNSALLRFDNALRLDPDFLWLQDRLERLLPDALEADDWVSQSPPHTVLRVPNFAKIHPQNQDLVLDGLRKFFYGRLGASARLTHYAEVETLVRAACGLMDVPYKAAPAPDYIWMISDAASGKSTFQAREMQTDQVYEIQIRDPELVQQLHEALAGDQPVLLVSNRALFGSNRSEPTLTPIQTLPDGSDFFAEPVLQQTSASLIIAQVPQKSALAAAYEAQVQLYHDAALAAMFYSLPAGPVTRPTTESRAQAPMMDVPGQSVFRPIQLPKAASSSATTSPLIAALGGGAIFVDAPPSSGLAGPSSAPSVVVVRVSRNSVFSTNDGGGLQAAQSGNLTVVPTTSAKASPQPGHYPLLEVTAKTGAQPGANSSEPAILPGSRGEPLDAPPASSEFGIVYADPTQALPPQQAPGVVWSDGVVGDNPAEVDAPLWAAAKDRWSVLDGRSFEEVFRVRRRFMPELNEYNLHFYSGREMKGTLLFHDIQNWQNLDEQDKIKTLLDLNHVFELSLGTYGRSNSVGPQPSNRQAYRASVQRLQRYIINLNEEQKNRFIADAKALVNQRSAAYHSLFGMAIEDMSLDHDEIAPELDTRVVIAGPKPQAWKIYSLAQVKKYGNMDNFIKLPRDCQSWASKEPEDFQTVFNEKIQNNPQNYNVFLAMLLDAAGNTTNPARAESAKEYLNTYYPSHPAYLEFQNPKTAKKK